MCCPHSRRKSGFTLLEVMVVIAIIGALATIVAPNILRHLADANVSAAKGQIESIALALDTYRLDTSSYPTTSEGLMVLREPPAAQSARWRGPYLRKEVPLDPWGRAYIYRSPGRHGANGFDLYSLGRDGLPGGEGEDQDITSWGGPVQ